MKELVKLSYLYSAWIVVGFVLALGPIESDVWGEENDERPLKILKSFHHPKPDVLDGFGMAVAGHLDWVLVGTPYEVHQGREAGRAYLLNRMTGHLIQDLGLPRPTGGALFGQSVVLSESFVGVGAPHSRDGEGTYTGGVYLFDPLMGKHIMIITNPNPVTGAFGHALATKGKRLVVGDPQASTETTYYTGAAYVYDVATGDLVHSFHPTKLTPGRPGGFGQSVACSNSMVLVGAPREPTESMGGGVVYAFNANSGTLVRKFRNPGSDESMFGWSVAIEDDLILIGGFGYEGTYREEGIVYLFHLTSGNLLLTVHNPHPRDGAQFGKTVAILPEVLVVGAPGDRVVDAGWSKGAIYVFDRKTGKFLTKISNPAKPAGADDLFGESLARVGDHLLVGAPFGGEKSGLDAGLVYELQLTNVGLLERVPSQLRIVPNSLPE